MLIAIFEILLGTTIIMVMITQVICPYFRGTPFFPMFKKEAALHNEIQDVRQESLEADMVNEIQDIKEDIRKKMGLDTKKVNKKRAV